MGLEESCPRPAHGPFEIKVYRQAQSGGPSRKHGVLVPKATLGPPHLTLPSETFLCIKQGLSLFLRPLSKLWTGCQWQFSTPHLPTDGFRGAGRDKVTLERFWPRADRPLLCSADSSWPQGEGL